MRALLQYTLDLFAAQDLAPGLPRARDPAPPDASVMPDPAPAVYRHPRANREIRLGEAVVGYQFKRGKRRTIGFSVGPDGLVVHAPRWVALTDVQDALNEKAGWIVRKLVETSERHDRMVASRIVWQDGAVIPYLGEPMQVILDPRQALEDVDAALEVETDAGSDQPRLRLLLGLPQHAQPGQIRDATQAWLMRQATRVFTERLDHFAPRLHVQWRKLSLSSAGTRWGSARADGSIRLHWRLIHFRAGVIDYVVAHELSHLRVMDHSPRFWDTVRSVVPDYALLRGQLKDEAVPKWS